MCLRNVVYLMAVGGRRSGEAEAEGETASFKLEYGRRKAGRRRRCLSKRLGKRKKEKMTMAVLRGLGCNEQLVTDA